MELIADFVVVFLPDDRAWALWLAWQIEETGHSVILQEWDARLLPQQRIPAGEGNTQPRWIIVLSNTAPSDIGTGMSEAFVRVGDGSAGGIVTIVARIDDVEPQGLLAAGPRVDLFAVTSDVARQRLVSAIGAFLEPGQQEHLTVPQEPPFPVRSPTTRDLGLGDSEATTHVSIRTGRAGGQFPLRRVRRALARAWDWFNRQSGAFQVIIALAALVVAIVLPLYATKKQEGAPSDITLPATPNQLVASSAQGVPANGGSGRPALDSSGRFVVFTSTASNLADNSGGYYNIYRKDRDTGLIYLASRGANGEIPNGDSQFPAICSTGRWVAFASTATNLLNSGPALSEHLWRVYVHDTLSSTTQLVSVAMNGSDPGADSRNPQFSADCSRIVFESTATTLTSDRAIPEQYSVYVRDLRTLTTTLASIAADGSPLDGDSTHADISPDGNTVAFTSWATNLPASTGGSGIPHVYLEDLASRQVTAPSAAFVNSGDSTLRGFSWPDFSPDGRYLIFRSITDPSDPSERGRYVFVWDMTKTKNMSALTSADGSPVGWSDACVSGVNNGTSFSPKISNASASHGYRVLFTVPGPQRSACQLVFRELSGPDIPVKPQQVGQEILEPALNDTGDVLSWAVAGATQLVYACAVAHCTG